MKIFNKSFKNPLKKDNKFALVSNGTVEDNERLIQAKVLLDKTNSEEQFDDLDGEESLNQSYDDDEEFERDEDLSRTKTIDPLENERKKLDSLRQIYAKLEKEEAEENLKIRIIKKQESIANKREKMQEMIDEQRERDKFYEEPKNDEGYWVLKEDKWNREYDELMIKLAQTEGIENQKPIQQQLKKLENIKKKNKAKNTMNKITRGINKTTQKIASVSKGIGKFADEIGEMGNQMGAVGSANQRKASGKTQKKNEFSQFETFFQNKPSSGGKVKVSKEPNFENFFSDKPKKAKTERKTTKRKTTKKRKPATKPAKKKKTKAKKKRKTSKTKTKTTTKPRTDWANFFK